MWVRAANVQAGVLTVVLRSGGWMRGMEWGWLMLGVDCLTPICTDDTDLMGLVEDVWTKLCVVYLLH